MKMQKTFLLTALLITPLIIPVSANAAWEVASPESTVPREPFFQAGTQERNSYLPSAYGGRAFPQQYANLGAQVPVYAISISGSLKENLERIMGRYHWKVIWKAPFDYNYDGRVTGASLTSVVEKLLEPFPLQAVMYMSNRTLAVIPREKLT